MRFWRFDMWLFAKLSSTNPGPTARYQGNQAVPLIFQNKTSNTPKAREKKYGYHPDIERKLHTEGAQKKLNFEKKVARRRRAKKNWVFVAGINAFFTFFQ